MVSKTLIFAALIFLIVFSSFSTADQVKKIVVWITGSLGVGVDYTNSLTMVAGGTNGTWVTIANTGNIRDVMRLEANIIEPPGGGYKDWIKFTFKCGETMGICDGKYDSEPKIVDEIQLTSDMHETRVYLEVTSYKVSGIPPPNITLTAYSLTDYIKSDVGNIEIITINPTGSYDSAELPGINPMWLPLLLIFSGLIFYRKLA